MISVLDLQPEITLIRKQLDAAYHRVMDHGRFIMVPKSGNWSKKWRIRRRLKGAGKTGLETRA